MTRRDKKDLISVLIFEGVSRRSELKTGPGDVNLIRSPP